MVGTRSRKSLKLPAPENFGEITNSIQLFSPQPEQLQNGRNGLPQSDDLLDIQDELHDQVPPNDTTISYSRTHEAHKTRDSNLSSNMLATIAIKTNN